jgi:glycosyltransferase involved in cell wall biosynthesis
MTSDNGRWSQGGWTRLRATTQGIEMDEGTETQQRTWFDLTTSYSLSDRNPVGLSRLEMNVLRAAMLLPREQVGFCFLNKSTQRFDVISRERVERLLSGFGKSNLGPAASSSKHRRRKARPQNAVREFFRSFERSIRHAIRGSEYRSRRTRNESRKDSELMRNGDRLVISGALWHFANIDCLEELLNSKQIELFAILADMIPWKFPHFYSLNPSSQTFVEYALMLARRASSILSISQSGTDDFRTLAEQHRLVPRQITQVKLGSNFEQGSPEKPSSLPSDLQSGQFILNVSTIQVRKNHHLLYSIWRRMREAHRADTPYLVLVGAKGRLCDDLVYLMQNDPLVKDRIVMLSEVTDSQLAWLYQNCNFTVYPSFYEGWGLPIVESLDYGKACIASSSSSMPEASQGLAKHLDPYSFDAWHDAISEWIDNPRMVALAEEKITRSYCRHTWDDFVEQMVSVLKEAPSEERKMAA